MPAPVYARACLLVFLALAGGVGQAGATHSDELPGAVVFDVRAPSTLAQGESGPVTVSLASGLSTPVTIRIDLAEAPLNAKDAFLAEPQSKAVVLGPRDVADVTFDLRASPHAPEGTHEAQVTVAYTTDGKRHQQIHRFQVEVPPADSSNHPLENTVPLAVGVAVAGGLGAATFAFIRRWDWRHASGALLAPLYSRIRRSEVLDNERRRRIHDAIEEEPGIHFTALMRKTGLPNGALYHHLSVLERNGLITSRRMGGRRVFSPAGRETASEDVTRAEHDLLDLLPLEGITQAALAERLGITRQGVNYHVKNLEAKGALRQLFVEDEWRCFRPEDAEHYL